VKKSALAVFRHLPDPLRRLVVHAATPSYTVGAVAVLRDASGRMALVEQRHSLGWALPGGLLGRGESAAQGLVREVAEEVGVALDPLTLPVPFAVLATHARRVDIVYFVDAPPGVPLRSHDVEVVQAEWFPLDALPEISEPTADILRGVRLL